MIWQLDLIILNLIVLCALAVVQGDGARTDAVIDDLCSFGPISRVQSIRLGG